MSACCRDFKSRLSLGAMRPQLFWCNAERLSEPQHGLSLRAARSVEHHRNCRLTDTDSLGKLGLGQTLASISSRSRMAKAASSRSIRASTSFAQDRRSVPSPRPRPGPARARRCGLHLETESPLAAQSWSSAAPGQAPRWPVLEKLNRFGAEIVVTLDQGQDDRAGACSADNWSVAAAAVGNPVSFSRVVSAMIRSPPLKLGRTGRSARP